MRGVEVDNSTVYSGFKIDEETKCKETLEGMYIYTNFSRKKRERLDRKQPN